MIAVTDGPLGGIECYQCVGRRVHMNIAEETTISPPKLLTVAPSVPCNYL